MYLAQRFPIERVASGIVTIWGICLVLTVACRTHKDLYAQRFFLGLLESGISYVPFEYGSQVQYMLTTFEVPCLWLSWALSTRRTSKLSAWGEYTLQILIELSTDVY